MEILHSVQDDRGKVQDDKEKVQDDRGWCAEDGVQMVSRGWCAVQ